MIKKQNRTVLVPVDYSPQCLDWAARTFEEELRQDHVIFFHVLASLPPMTPGVVWNRVADEHRVKVAKSCLLDELQKRGISGAQIEVRVGDAANTICRFAAECGAELVVMTTHARRGLTRLIHGSVAARVLRHAPCPVMVRPSGQTCQSHVKAGDPVHN